MSNQRGASAADGSSAFMVVSGITAKQEFCLSSSDGA